MTNIIDFSERQASREDNAFLDPGVIEASRRAEADLIEDKLRSLKFLSEEDKITFAFNLARLLRDVSSSGKRLYDLTAAAGFGSEVSSKALYDYTLPLDLSLDEISPSRLKRLKKKPRRYLQLAKIAGEFLYGDGADGISKLVEGSSIEALTDLPELSIHDRESVRLIERLISEGVSWIERNSRIRQALNIAASKGFSKSGNEWTANRQPEYVDKVFRESPPFPDAPNSRNTFFSISEKPKHWNPVGPTLWLGAIGRDCRSGVRHTAQGDVQEVSVYEVLEISLLLTIHDSSVEPIFLSQALNYIEFKAENSKKATYSTGRPTVVFPGEVSGSFVTWEEETHGLDLDLRPAVYEAEGHLTFIEPKSEMDHARLIYFSRLVNTEFDGLPPQKLIRASSYGIASLFVRDPIVEAIYDGQPAPGFLKIVDDPQSWLGQSFEQSTIAVNPNLAKLEAALSQPIPFSDFSSTNVESLPDDRRQSGELTIIEALLMEADKWADGLFKFDEQSTQAARTRVSNQLSKFTPSSDKESD